MVVSVSADDGEEPGEDEEVEGRAIDCGGASRVFHRSMLEQMRLLLVRQTALSPSVDAFNSALRLSEQKSA